MALSIEEMHQRILYPVVRIRHAKAGGSGTVIFSQPKPEDSEEYENYVLTNNHVIADLVTVKKQWDSVLKKNIDMEITAPCTVEVFSYVHLSKRDSGATFEGQVVAYDERHDLAIVRIETPTKMRYVAELFPKDQPRGLKLFTDIWTCGCSLGHEPVVNKGQLTSLTEQFENLPYFMCNSHIIFGNSGGAAFLGETGQLIGVPSRVSVLPLGFSADIITWLGFLVPVSRVYQFMEEQELQFLYDSSQTSAECFKRREERQERARREAARDEEEAPAVVTDLQGV